MAGELRKIKLTKHKVQSIATQTIVFLTLVSMGCWVGPLLSTTWHVKRYFIGLGAVATIDIKFGLWGYDADFGCDNKKYEWTKKLCSKITGDGENGEHSYDELQDWLCNAEQATRGIMFRGCDAVQMLDLASTLCGVLIGISLLLLLMGSVMCYMYYFVGIASKKTYHWMIGFYVMAPVLQLTALVGYVMLTHDMDQILDPGFINRIPGGHALVGSPTGTISFNHAFIAAFCCMIFSTSPLICLNFARRDKELEAEYLDWYNDAGGYGATDQKGQWSSYADVSQTGCTLPSGYDQSQQQYDPNVGYGATDHEGQWGADQYPSQAGSAMPSGGRYQYDQTQQAGYDPGSASGYGAQATYGTVY